MNFKDELLSLFPTIEVLPYTYSLYPFIRNNRTYNVLIFYRVRIKCGKKPSFYEFMLQKLNI